MRGASQSAPRRLRTGRPPPAKSSPVACPPSAPEFPDFPEPGARRTVVPGMSGAMSGADYAVAKDEELSGELFHRPDRPPSPGSLEEGLDPPGENGRTENLTDSAPGQIIGPVRRPRGIRQTREGHALLPGEFFGQAGICRGNGDKLHAQTPELSIGRTQLDELPAAKDSPQVSQKNQEDRASLPEKREGYASSPFPLQSHVRSPVPRTGKSERKNIHGLFALALGNLSGRERSDSLLPDPETP